MGMFTDDFAVRMQAIRDDVTTPTRERVQRYATEIRTLPVELRGVAEWVTCHVMNWSPDHDHGQALHEAIYADV